MLIMAVTKILTMIKLINQTQNRMLFTFLDAIKIFWSKISC